MSQTWAVEIYVAGYYGIPRSHVGQSTKKFTVQGANFKEAVEKATIARNAMAQVGCLWMCEIKSVINIDHNGTTLPSIVSMNDESIDPSLDKTGD